MIPTLCIPALAAIGPLGTPEIIVIAILIGILVLPVIVAVVVVIWIVNRNKSQSSQGKQEPSAQATDQTQSYTQPRQQAGPHEIV